MFYHNMWGVAPMTALKVNYDIRYFEKYVYFLDVLTAKEALFPKMQTDLSGMPYFF